MKLKDVREQMIAQIDILSDEDNHMSIFGSNTYREDGETNKDFIGRFKKLWEERISKIKTIKINEPTWVYDEHSTQTPQLIKDIEQFVFCWSFWSYGAEIGSIKTLPVGPEYVVTYTQGYYRYGGGTTVTPKEEYFKEIEIIG